MQMVIRMTRMINVHSLPPELLGDIIADFAGERDRASSTTSSTQLSCTVTGHSTLKGSSSSASTCSTPRCYHLPDHASPRDPSI